MKKLWRKLRIKWYVMLAYVYAERRRRKQWTQEQFVSELKKLFEKVEPKKGD